MTKFTAALRALFVMSVMAAFSDAAMPDDRPAKSAFAADALAKTPSVATPAAEFINATDGVPIAYYPFRAAKPVATLVFYHGGGAHSLAGYQTLADALSRQHRISTYLVDIRGHGRSGGARGDAPSAEQVWRDVSTVTAAVRAERGDVPLFLGAHSSGAGLLLNYLDHETSNRVTRFVFIAPEFGYKAKVKRDTYTSFAKVSIWKFVVNAMSAGILCGHCEAVRFAYSEKQIKESGLLPGYTVNMANAVTPSAPADQLKRLKGKLAVWVGTDDELFDSEKLARFLDDARTPSLTIDFRTVPKATHLSVLLNVDTAVGEWIGAEAAALR